MTTLIEANSNFSPHLQVYLPWETIVPSGTFQGATVIGLLVFFSYAIVLNTVVPISLYVSVEVSVMRPSDDDFTFHKFPTSSKKTGNSFRSIVPD